MKKKVLSFSSIVFLSIIMILYANGKDFPFCQTHGTGGRTIKTCENIFFDLFPFVFVFIFSLITYKMKDEVFHLWVHFTSWWIPLSIFCIYLSAGSSGGSTGIPNVLSQEFFALFFTAMYFIISSIIVITKWLKK